MARALQRQGSGGSGNLNGITSGSVVNGTTMLPLTWARESVTCLVALNLTTNTMTVTVKFQGSTDSSTWYDIAGDAQNPANVAIATGTGSPVATNKILPLPQGAERWPYMRAC